ncbi:MAG: diguanylate cyclase [Anaerolineaceae bacterium]|nr:diguanylate cyclase [Anaerolineaceae bacterium]
MDTQLSKTLQDNSSPFKTILDQTSLGVVILDQDRITQYLNPKAETLLGMDSNTLGKTFNWLIEPGTTSNQAIQNAKEEKIVKFEALDWQWEETPLILLYLHDVTQSSQDMLSLQQSMDAAEFRVQELESIRFVTEQLSKTNMMEETIQAGLETILALSNTSAVWLILTTDDKTNLLTAIYTHGDDLISEQARIYSDDRFIALDYLINGKLQEPAYISECFWIRQGKFGVTQSERHMALPLSFQDETLGVLNIALGDERVLDSQEMELLQAISNQLSAAIYRSRPYMQAGQALYRQNELNEITRTLSGALDLPNILQNVVKLAIDLLEADGGSIGLLTPNKQRLTFLYNFPNENMQPPLVIGDSVVWKVLETQESTIIPEYQSQSDIYTEDFLPDANYLILVPLIHHEENLGVLTLYTNTAKEFNSFDLALAQSLGQQAGTAIVNAQLYFEVQQLTLQDQLTGLHNKRSFKNLAVKEVERAWRYKRPMSFLALNIDQFRVFNEQFGTEIGDELLKELAYGLSNSLRKVDLLGRFRDDIFLILLPETNIHFAHEVAERLRERATNISINTPKGPASFKVSIGLVELLTSSIIDLDNLIGRSLDAAAIAKEKGGDQVTIWEPA